MTLYTVMPMDQLWEGAIQSTVHLKELNIQGMLMQVEPLEQGRVRIIRLLQCPLNRYLDPSLSPGSVISFPF